MSANSKIAVLIATSMGRDAQLFGRSLASVLRQTRKPDMIVVVDDNEDNTVSGKIRFGLAELDVPVVYLENRRTRGFSGTGAWNTGIEYISKEMGKDCHVAILDDDDSWDAEYLEECERAADENTMGVFAYIERSDCGVLRFSVEDLTVESFLVGDPGVQGSNMFFKARVLLAVGCFDETLRSCADRDLMVRFLSKYPASAVKVVPRKLVNYVAGPHTVSASAECKECGLTTFFRKHIGRYDETMLERALTRAEKLFGFGGAEEARTAFRESIAEKSGEAIAIGIAVHNNEGTLGRCLCSVLRQTGTVRQVLAVVLDDCSSDGCNDALKRLDDRRILSFRAENGNVPTTRNQLNELIRRHVPNAVLVGRLDADDEMCGDSVLSEIERIYDETRADVIVAGNRLRKDGVVISEVNRATEELLDGERLLGRLRRMSEGDATAELPSCNVFARPAAMLPYPNIQGAEDHALLVRYLQNAPELGVRIAERILYCIYNLDGRESRENRKRGTYLVSRKLLYQEAKRGGASCRVEEARDILEAYGVSSPAYLGRGQEGVVFHDAASVYKVVMPFYPGKDASETKRHLSYFANIVAGDSFYRLDEVVDFEGHVIEKYPYEPSEPVFCYSEEEAIRFLSDCWSAKIIVKDCKPQNFIRIGRCIKLVDMDACSYYDDNLFLNMCVRMFLHARFFGTMDPDDFRKLARSAINNFDSPQLEGAREFVNAVFREIIRKESSAFELDAPRTSDCAAPAVFPEKVSLLIKTCGQDWETIEANVRHIVKQLSTPDPFFEVVLSIDCKKGEFLRAFAPGNLGETVEIARKLQESGVIDRYFIYDETLTREINRRWFGVECDASHTTGNVPVASQLHAFEQCGGEYVLQTDSDVLVGRRDRGHSFLADMIGELEKNPKVLSIGFNICNASSKAYFGFENGGFVPEVRLCLFRKQRLLDSRPWPNVVASDGRLELSWYRSLEKHQKDTGFCSIRGGDNRSFFIHPQNYRKTSAYSWLYILDRVEQGFVPPFQNGKWDCEGSLRSWCNPKRREKMVVVSCFRNVPPDRFTRMWASLMSQSFQEFGVVLHDDCSDNGLPDYVEKLIVPCKERVTFIKGRVKQEKMQSEYLAIRYFVDNPQSVIVCLDADDALIGKDALLDVWKKYELWGADVVVGRVHQTYRLQASYRYPVNFSEPRASGGGNVWQHLKTFRKHLFDSIPLPYLKHSCGEGKLSGWRWIERCDDYAMMVPIVEMSSSPLQMDFVNYYYERDYEARDDCRETKNRCIKDVLDKPRLSPADAFVGRKTFVPSVDRIEIDITCDCNLKCKGCNRSCGMAPGKERMTLEQIRTFVRDSIDLGKKWRLVNVLGGEPTLHPDFLEIVGALQTEYVDCFSPDTVIQVVSNGFFSRSRELCDRAEASFKNVRIDRNSFKTRNVVDYFSPFNDAPVDDPAFENADYSKGCWVCSHCGIGLNSNGYYACGVCGGIERVLATDYGIRNLKDVSIAGLQEQLRFFCRYCGNYKAYAENFGEFLPRCEKAPFKEVISPSWEKIYRDFRNRNGTE